MLTLSEMAVRYKRTPKTFRKHVLEKGIPYELLGRSMMFDPVAVSNHLKAVREAKSEKAKTVRHSRRKVVSNRFAEAVGL